jgi:hypothetical protein
MTLQNVSYVALWSDSDVGHCVVFRKLLDSVLNIRLEAKKKQAALVVALRICIWYVLGLYLGRDTGYPNWGVSWFS